MSKKAAAIRKTIRVQVRMTIADHNDLMRDAINQGCTLSDVIRKRAKLQPSGLK